jgi:hypothetical protein
LAADAVVARVRETREPLHAKCAHQESLPAADFADSVEVRTFGRAAELSLGPTIVLSLSIEPDTNPPRALAEGGFATFKHVADGFADRGVFQSTRHVADRRQAV